MAREFRRSPARISQLTSKLRQNPGVLAELLSQRTAKEKGRETVRQYIQEQVDKDAFVDSVKEIRLGLKNKHGIEATDREVS